MKFSIIAFVVLSFFLPFQARADWPQFRGDNAVGYSDDAVPSEWSADENVKWKTELPGPGSSSPVISGGAVFVTCYTGEGSDLLRHLLRYDLETGKEQWRSSVPVGFTEDPARGFILEHGWASNTPVTDGEHVFCYFGKAGVVAFDLEGNQIWKVETGSLSSQKQWGSASSPILYEDLVIVPAGDEMRAIVALDKKTGERRWIAEGDSMEQTYGSPTLVKVDEERTDIVFASTAEWWGLNPETGKLRWFAEYNLPGNMSNTTLQTGDLLTISGGFPRTARVAIKVGLKGDVTDQILYDTQKPATYMTMPVAHEGVLYWVSDSGIAFAARPGEADALWMERVPELTEGKGKPFYASPIIAGGKIYAQSRSNGVFVIEPSAESFKIVAQNFIEGDDTIFNATPAVSDGKLLLRSQSHLYCIAE